MKICLFFFFYDKMVSKIEKGGYYALSKTPSIVLSVSANGMPHRIRLVFQTGDAAQ
jgi:hypothetical protein